MELMIWIDDRFRFAHLRRVAQCSIAIVIVMTVEIPIMRNIIANHQSEHPVVTLLLQYFMEHGNKHTISLYIFIIPLDQQMSTFPCMLRVTFRNSFHNYCVTIFLRLGNVTRHLASGFYESPANLSNRSHNDFSIITFSLSGKSEAAVTTTMAWVMS